MNVKEARRVLRMVADPTFAGRTWDEVKIALYMDADEDVEFQAYASAQYSHWIHANLARVLLAGSVETCPVCKGSERLERKCLVCDGKGQIG